MTKLRGAIRHRLMLEVAQLKAPEQVAITNALQLAEKAHDGQLRKPSKENPKGEPYIVHPMRVALVLIEELGLKDHAAICAALLHDVIEDTDGRIGVGHIEEQFGKTVALMVSVLTKPPAKPNIERALQLKVYYDRISKSNIPTRLVKLADRLDNLRDIVEINDRDFQKQYLEETREIYLPLAEEADDYLRDEIEVLCEKLDQLLVKAK